MRLLMIALMALLLTACISIETTRSLNNLQNDFGELVRADANCKEYPLMADPCHGDIKTLYIEIEIEALATIGKIKNSTDRGDQQITIALYRLAAFASLKSDTNRAADYGDAGSLLCTSLGSAAPPRDCALLAVVGQYELSEAFVGDVNCLKSADCSETVDAATLVNGFCTTYNGMASKTDLAKKQPLLDAGVITFLDKQVASLSGAISSLEDYYIKPLGSQGWPKKACDCLGMDSSDPNFTSDCGQVPEASRMATFKAICIRKSLKKDPTRCPNL